jgi:uncharacterized protein YwbE
LRGSREEIMEEVDEVAERAVKTGKGTMGLLGEVHTRKRYYSNRNPYEQTIESGTITRLLTPSPTPPPPHPHSPASSSLPD